MELTAGWIGYVTESELKISHHCYKYAPWDDTCDRGAKIEPTARPIEQWLWSKSQRDFYGFTLGKSH